MSEQKNDVEIESVYACNLYFTWAIAGMGFGELTVFKNNTTGQIECMNECMTRETVRQLLVEMANKLADEMVLLDEPSNQTMLVAPLPPIIKGVKIFKNPDGTRSYVRVVDDHFFMHPKLGKILRSNYQYDTDYLDIRGDNITADELWMRNFGDEKGS